MKSTNKNNLYTLGDPALFAELDHFFELKQEALFSDLVHLFTPTLSRRPFLTTFFKNYLLDQKNLPSLLILKTVASFAFHFSLSALIEVGRILFIQKAKNLPASLEYLTISYFNFETLSASIHDDYYLAGLQKKLTNKDKKFLYLPISHLSPKNPFTLASLVKRIKKENAAYISIYEIIPRKQIFKLLFFGFFIFLKNLKYGLKKQESALEKIYSRSLVEDQKYAQLDKIVNYFAFTNLSHLTRIKTVFMWFENQVIDKLIIKGIRTANPQVHIIGCQFYLITPQEMNLVPTITEKKMKLVPDLLLVNHLPIKIGSTSSIKYQIVNSERYRYINSCEIVKKQHYKTALVFLSLIESSNENIISILKDSACLFDKILIKPHPALSKQSLPEIDSRFTLVSDSSKTLLKDLSIDIVFSSDSGVIFESIALGTQAIIIGKENNISYFVPSSKYHLKLYGYITSSQSIKNNLDALRSFKEVYFEEFKNLSYEFRHTFFPQSENELDHYLL
jgi:hypothetical protein